VPAKKKAATGKAKAVAADAPARKPAGGGAKAAKAKTTAKPVASRTKAASATPKAAKAPARKPAAAAKPAAAPPKAATARPKSATATPKAAKAPARAPAAATAKAAPPKAKATAAKPAPKAKAPKAAPPAAPRPARTRKREKLSPDRLTLLVEAAMKSLEDDKAENIVLLDVTGRADYADRLIIATGMVERQLQAMATHLDEALGKAGLQLRRDSIQASPDWVLIDAGDLVIHLFRPEARELYRIERMWGPESPGASDAAPG
jgi:ribosome silencing factor RsfS/YbeB/iojap